MSDSTTPQVPAGWYPDPAGGPRPRWWDGTSWTEYYADPTPAPAQPAPAAQPVVPPIVSTPAASGYNPVDPINSSFAPVEQTPAAPAQQNTPYVPFASQQATTPAYAAAPAYSGSTDLTAAPGTPTNTIWIWLTMLLPFVAILPLFTIDWTGYAQMVMDDPYGTSADLSLVTSPGFIGSMLLGLITVPLVILFSFLDYRALKNAGVPQPFHWAFAFFYLVLGTTAVYVIGRAVVVKRRTGSGLGIMWAQIGILVLMAIIGIVYIVMLFGAIMSVMPSDSYSYLGA